MGTAELPDGGDRQRQHDPDRPGEVGGQPGGGVLPLPDRSGGDLSRTLSAAQLQRQSRDPARCRQEAAGSRAAPLRGTGADLSFAEAEVTRSVMATRAVIA